MQQMPKAVANSCGLSPQHIHIKRSSRGTKKEHALVTQHLPRGQVLAVFSVGATVVYMAFSSTNMLRRWHGLHSKIDGDVTEKRLLIAILNIYTRANGPVSLQELAATSMIRSL